MRYKVIYYEQYCKDTAVIYLPSKLALTEFIIEKGHSAIMSWTKIDNQLEPYEYEMEV